MVQEQVYRDNWKALQASGDVILNDIASLKPASTRPDLLTACIFPTAEAAQALQRLSDELQGDFPGQHYLPQDYYHCTLAAFGALQGEVFHDPAFPRLADIHAAMENILAGFKSFTLRLEGLNRFRNCVFVQVHDDSGTLHAINQQLTKQLALKSPFAFIPHIALIYFKQDPLPLFARIEERYRAIPLGSFSVSEIAITRWLQNRSTDKKAHRVLHTVSLFR